MASEDEVKDLSNIPSLAQQLKTFAERINAVFSKNLRQHTRAQLERIIAGGRERFDSDVYVEVYEDPSDSGLAPSATLNISYKWTALRPTVTDVNDNCTYALYSAPEVSVNWPSCGSIDCDKAKSMLRLFSFVAEVGSNIKWELEAQGDTVKGLLYTPDERAERDRVFKETLDQRTVNVFIESNCKGMRVGRERVGKTKNTTNIAPGVYTSRMGSKTFETKVFVEHGMSGESAITFVVTRTE